MLQRFTRKKIVLITWLGAFALLVVISWSLAAFCRCMWEQMFWFPWNSDRLAMTEFEYSWDGIAARVIAPGGVSEVWKQTADVFAPWKAQHHRTDFNVIPQEPPGTWIVLVNYAFCPRREWLLALRSQDGLWSSESPYFPEEPTMSQAEWLELQALSSKGDGR